MKALLGLALLLVAPDQAPSVETRGLCAIDADTASCWDAQGTRLPTLSAEVDRRVRAWDGALAFVSGQKTRFFAVAPGDYAYATTGGEKGAAFYDLRAQGEPSLALVRVVAPPDATRVETRVHFGLLTGRPVDVPLREGAQTTVEDATVAIGKPVAGDDGRPGAARFPYPGPVWSFPVDLRSVDPRGALRFVALGRDGKPIAYVDAQGRPLDAAKAEPILRALAEASRRPGYDWSRVLAANPAWIEYGVMGGRDPSWATTNVDPKAVARLRVRRVADRQAVLGPYPQDPR